MRQPSFNPLHCDDPDLNRVQLAIKQALDALATSTRARAVKAVTASYRVQTSDEVVLVDPSAGDLTVTLPQAGQAKGLVFTVKHTVDGTHVVTVAAQVVAGFLQTIDGAATVSLPNAGDVKNVVSDGSSWWVL